MSRRRSRSRGLSPVIGVVLLVGIVLLLAVATSGVLFGLTEEREPAPEVTFSLERIDGERYDRAIVHEQGEIVDGDRVTLRGAAEPGSMAGSRYGAGDHHRILPIDETIRMVWNGEHGTSYTIWEATVSPAAVVPAPDVGCPWVQTESNGGNDDVKVDGLVVDCDVVTDKVIEVQADGVVIGDTDSHAKLLDADDGEILGDVTVEKDVNLQDARVDGSVTARTEGAKVDTATVDGSVEAKKVVEVVDDSRAGGDVVSANRDVKVLSSDIDGDVVADGTVKLQDATVEGDVYVTAANFDCTNAEIGGQNCSGYTPRDPDEY